MLAIHLRDRYALAARRLDCDIADAPVLDAHDDRAILEDGEVNSVARLEIRGGAHSLRNRGLALTRHRCECHSRRPCCIPYDMEYCKRLAKLRPIGMRSGNNVGGGGTASESPSANTRGGPASG